MALRQYSDLLTRTLGGQNNRTEGQDSSDWKVNDDSRFHDFYNDFDRYAAADWVVTVTGVTPTATMVNGDGGQLLLTTTGATGDKIALQWAGNSGAVNQGFNFDPKKDLIIKTLFQVDDATNAAFIFGLYDTNVNPITALPANGLYLYKAAGATTLIGSVANTSVVTSLTLGNIAAATFVQATLVYIANIGTWGVFLNDVLAARSLVLSNMPALATGLIPSFALQNGSAAIRTAKLDYIWIAKER